MKRNICILLALLMVISTAACGAKSAQVQDIEIIGEVQELGEGEKQFDFYAVDSEGKASAFIIHTDAETVGEALLENELISGDESSYGLYVKTVNGVTADYDKDGCYWALYIDGKYAPSGVDSTEIEDGASYMFKIEK